MQHDQAEWLTILPDATVSFSGTFDPVDGAGVTFNARMTGGPRYVVTRDRFGRWWVSRADMECVVGGKWVPLKVTVSRRCWTRFGARRLMRRMNRKVGR